MNDTPSPWRYLVRKPGTVYEQLFVKDRWVRARTLYGMHVREEDPMTIEEIAADYNIPVDAVKEAIAYCESNPPELLRDYAREEATLRASGLDDPASNGKPRLLSPEELHRLSTL